MAYLRRLAYTNKPAVMAGGSKYLKEPSSSIRTLPLPGRCFPTSIRMVIDAEPATDRGERRGSASGRERALTPSAHLGEGSCQRLLPLLLLKEYDVHQLFRTGPPTSA